MRLLWLDINASFSHSSLAFPSLEAQLTDSQRKRIKWQVVRGTIKSDPSACLLDVIESAPDVIFATLWLFNHNYVMAVLKRVNALYPKIKILLGGPEFLGDNHFFLRNNPEVCAVFRGEGEEFFPELIQCLLDSKDWYSLQGICFLDASGFYHDNGEVFVNNFGKLTPPENSEFFNWEKPFIQIETSRGCFNNCKFCVSGKSGNRTNNLPVDSLRSRLNKVKDKRIREVRILDRTFNANPSRAIELLNLFEEYSTFIQFHLEVHPSFLTQKLREKLLDIPKGLLHVEVGIQSLDDIVLNASGRKGDASKAIEGLNFLISADKFDVHADLIAGLPFYSFDRLFRDLITLIDAGPDEIQLEALKILPGTDLRENSKQYGIVYSPCPPYEVLRSGHIKAAELIMAANLSRITDIWYNDKRWQKLIKKIIKNDPGFLQKFLNYLLINHSLKQTISLETSGLILYEFCENNCIAFLDDISEAWVFAGLSLNKKPAIKVKKWSPHRDENLFNPLFQNGNVDHSFYYLDGISKLIWFEFEKSSRGAVPIKSFLE